ncbi:Protein of unknown function [Roseivivax lentus]|uniref:DUF1523 domain-containing protein n=1 Tax=Roseivivax lentus TaxID=633194 RepID=A0A1N7JWF2_9RHOB|nr:DUF1523 family protein [Roseivivax lentus]SIS53663.1 Protein of unknown function [Roseivivax lentus]
MAYVKWTLIALWWIVVLSFLHYTLPQNDIARITDTYEKREDIGANALFWTRGDAGAAQADSRDVFFIQTRRAGDDIMVYRNEDTGWGWPPFFKFDSSNLQAEAADLRSTAEAPRWVAIRHYGWRLEFLSVFPNALSIKPVAGPDVTIIPWRAIFTLILMVAVFWAIWVRWRRFRQARIDPVLDQVEDSFDDATDGLRSRRKRLTDWFRGR